MSWNRALSTFALLVAAPLAQAGFMQWEMVELPPDVLAARADVELLEPASTQSEPALDEDAIARAAISSTRRAGRPGGAPV